VSEKCWKIRKYARNKYKKLKEKHDLSSASADDVKSRADNDSIPPTCPENKSQVATVKM
jgi:hypothetical protein